MEDKLRAAGGPAFPVSIPGCGDNGWEGMTLRDWFAGQALTGLLASDMDGAGDVFATTAYEIADTMLSVRRKDITE